MVYGHAGEFEPTSNDVTQKISTDKLEEKLPYMKFNDLIVNLHILSKELKSHIKGIDMYLFGGEYPKESENELNDSRPAISVLDEVLVNMEMAYRNLENIEKQLGG